MIVVDASVLVPALCDAGAHGVTARRRLQDETVAAPELVDLECLSAIRGLASSHRLSATAAERACRLLAATPISRSPHRHLLTRCWELRANLTVYDAAYVALAELLGVVLVTADARLARAPGIACDVDLLSA